MKKLITFLLASYLLCFNILGYDFTKDAEEIIQNIKKSDPNFIQEDNQIRLTVLFDESNRSELKKKIDLVKIKSDLVNSLASKVKVTNAYTVIDYLKDKKISALDIINESDIRFKTVDDFKNTHFLLVDFIVSSDEKLVVIYQIYEALEFTSTGLKIQHTIEQSSSNFLADNNLSIESIKDKKNLQKAGVSIKNFFLSGINFGSVLAAWNYFHPTAFLNKTDKSFMLDTNIWMYDSSRVNISLRHLRLGFRFKIFQSSIVLNGDEFKRLQSGYVYLKINILNESNLNNFPLFGSFGIKIRYYLNPDSTHLQTGANKNKDAITFFGALNYRIDIGRSYKGFIGFYIDNVGLNLDLDMLFPYNFLVGSSLLIPRINRTVREKNQPINYSSANFVFYLKHITNQYFEIAANYEIRTKSFSLGFKIKI